jgi:hypothetical protein
MFVFLTYSTQTKNFLAGNKLPTMTTTVSFTVHPCSVHQCSIALAQLRRSTTCCRT